MYKRTTDINEQTRQLAVILCWDSGVQLTAGRSGTRVDGRVIAEAP